MRPIDADNLIEFVKHFFPEINPKFIDLIRNQKTLDTLLKPCPLCHNEDLKLDFDTDIETPYKDNQWYVFCHKCGVTTKFYDEKVEAINAWNNEIVDYVQENPM